jgi:hypothetical protein
VLLDPAAVDHRAVARRLGVPPAMPDHALPFPGTFQLGDAASQLALRALVPVEYRLQPRGLDLAPFQTESDAVENEQLVLDPAEPASTRSTRSPTSL